MKDNARQIKIKILPINTNESYKGCRQNKEARPPSGQNEKPLTSAFIIQMTMSLVKLQWKVKHATEKQGNNLPLRYRPAPNYNRLPPGHPHQRNRSSKNHNKNVCESAGPRKTYFDLAAPFRSILPDLKNCQKRPPSI